MKTLQLFLKEDKAFQLEMIQDFIKMEIVYGSKLPEYEHELTMAKRRADRIGVDLDDLRKKVKATWKPGLCPKCHGLGFIPTQKAYERDLFCSQTGFYGMTSSQVQWFIKTQKELDSAVMNWKRIKDINDIPNWKLSKDIITAAKRLGIKNADYDRDYEPDEYESEWYQGHEHDWYFDHLNRLMYQIPLVIAKKAGWKKSTYTD